LYGEETLVGDLARLGDELRFVLITSGATLAPLAAAPAEAVQTEVAGLKLKIVKSGLTKCARCWHFCADVGSHAEHPEICGRCVSNIDGQGEVRHHA
ncbi:isoleucine--tRNA ligase, partial [Pseudomonas sp. CrR14]|nr:isoleucine--tRNA ligase [Pseudomonas sp. CrR14]